MEAVMMDSLRDRNDRTLCLGHGGGAGVNVFGLTTEKCRESVGDIPNFRCLCDSRWLCPGGL